MNIEDAWAKRPTDTDYAVYGALGDSADGDIEDWCRDVLLAVLDAAENSGCIYPYCETPCENCPLDALRREIEKLP